MGNCEKLKEEYLDSLSKMIQEHKAIASDLRENGADDEAILESIKGNVVNIFYQVFDTNYKMNSGRSVNSLAEDYLKFFDKIPAPWKIKMLKDKEHNMLDEYYKEKIKLETADQVKEIFINHYERCL